MQFLVEMRSGGSYLIEAKYIEVVSGPRSSSYTFLGPTPGFPTAIIATFPVDLVAAVLPLEQSVGYTPRRGASGGHSDVHESDGAPHGRREPAHDDSD